MTYTTKSTLASHIVCGSLQPLFPCTTLIIKILQIMLLLFILTSNCYCTTGQSTSDVLPTINIVHATTTPTFRINKDNVHLIKEYISKIAIPSIPPPSVGRHGVDDLYHNTYELNKPTRQHDDSDFDKNAQNVQTSSTYPQLQLSSAQCVDTNKIPFYPFRSYLFALQFDCYTCDEIRFLMSQEKNQLLMSTSSLHYTQQQQQQQQQQHECLVHDDCMYFNGSTHLDHYCPTAIAKMSGPIMQQWVMYYNNQFPIDSPQLVAFHAKCGGQMTPMCQMYQQPTCYLDRCVLDNWDYPTDITPPLDDTSSVIIDHIGDSNIGIGHMHLDPVVEQPGDGGGIDDRKAIEQLLRMDGVGLATAATEENYIG